MLPHASVMPHLTKSHSPRHMHGQLPPSIQPSVLPLQLAMSAVSVEASPQLALEIQIHQPIVDVDSPEQQPISISSLIVT